MGDLSVKSKRIWDNIYLIIFGLYLTIDVLNTTMFDIKWPDKIGYLQYAMVAGYAIARGIVYLKCRCYRMSEVILSVCIAVTFSIPAVFTTSYSYLFGIAFLIIGAKDVDFDEILRVYICITAIIVLAALVSSQIGLIENLQFVDENRGVRNSLGAIYPTDFGAHIFYLCVAWICYRRRKIKLIELIIMLVMTAVTYHFCATKTSTLCTILIVLIYIANRIITKLNSRFLLSLDRIVCMTAQLAAPISAAVYMAMQWLYDPLNKYWSLLDMNVMSLRFYYTYHVQEQYKMTLFGQNIAENGFGGGTDTSNGYIFLDDSYMAIAMKYGLLVFIVVLILLVIGQHKAMKNNMTIIVLMGGVIAIHSIMEHHLLEIAYNPLLMLAFAGLNNKGEIGKGKDEDRDIHKCKRFN